VIAVNKNKIITYSDRVIMVCLCLLFFCLPFAKAGVETFTWMAIFLWLFKRALGYCPDSMWGLLPRSELNKALAIFVLVNLLSVALSVNLGLSLRAFFGKVLKFLAIYFMLVETINSKKRLKYFFIVFVLVVIMMLADSVSKYYRKADFLWHSWTTSLSASFKSPNGFAGWLVVIIPLTLGLFFNVKVKNTFLKLLIFILSVLLTLCLIMTYTRGAWLSFALGLLLMIFYIIKNATFKMRMFYFSLAFTLGVTFIVLPQPIKTKLLNLRLSNYYGVAPIGSRFSSLLEVEDGSTPIRFNLWKEAVRIAADYPLIGCGLNTYSIIARNYKSFPGGGVYPHNSYLQMFAETGLFGLTAFLWVLFTFFVTGLRQLNKQYNALLLGALSGILGFSVHAFFDTHLYSLQLVVLFWFTLGLSMAIIKLQEQVQSL